MARKDGIKDWGHAFALRSAASDTTTTTLLGDSTLLKEREDL
jgi:hypothetical protein